MNEKKKAIVPEAIREAVNTLLRPYGAEWNPEVETRPAIREPEIERPLTRKEACKILSVSLPTLNSFVHKGLLKKIVLGPRHVAITPESVRNMLKNIANPGDTQTNAPECLQSAPIITGEE